MKRETRRLKINKGSVIGAMKRYRAEFPKLLLEHLSEGWSFWYFPARMRALGHKINMADLRLWVLYKPQIATIKEQYDEYIQERRKIGVYNHDGNCFRGQDEPEAIRRQF